MARLHTGRPKVLSTYRSYHGGTQLAINLTGDPRRWANDHGIAGTVHFFGPFLYRSAFHATHRGGGVRARARAPRRRSSPSRARRRSRRSCSSRSPAPPASWSRRPGYLAGVRELCDRHGIVLVADEVMAGFGRAGTLVRLRALSTSCPTCITFAKGVNSGYVPLGGVGDQRRRSPRPSPTAPTPAASPTPATRWPARPRSRRSARWRTSGVVEHAARLGDEVFGPGLEALPTGTRAVGEVRGTGAFWAVELVSDREHPRAARAVRRQQPGDGRDPRRAAGGAGCCPSPTSTASTWCRR